MLFLEAAGYKRVVPSKNTSPLPLTFGGSAQIYMPSKSLRVT